MILMGLVLVLVGAIVANRITVSLDAQVVAQANIVQALSVSRAALGEVTNDLFDLESGSKTQRVSSAEGLLQVMNLMQHALVPVALTSFPASVPSSEMTILGEYGSTLIWLYQAGPVLLYDAKTGRIAAPGALQLIESARLALTRVLWSLPKIMLLVSEGRPLSGYGAVIERGYSAAQALDTQLSN